MDMDVTAEAEASAEVASPDVDAANPDAGADVGFEDAGSAAQTEPGEGAAGGDELYEVVVNGETLQVTLDELLKGYSRQADYTRKTQELAQQRAHLQQVEALAAALERDPASTIQALADAYGVAPARPQRPQQTPDDAWDDFDDGEPDPYEERFARLERYMVEQERRAAIAQIEQEMKALQEQYGPFDQNELIAYTLQHGHSSVTEAFKAMNFKKQQEQQAALEAKKRAQVVQGAKPTQKRAVSAPPKDLPLREIIRQAIRQAQG